MRAIPGALRQGGDDQSAPLPGTSFGFAQLATGALDQIEMRQACTAQSMPVAFPQHLASDHVGAEILGTSSISLVAIDDKRIGHRHHFVEPRNPLQPVPIFDRRQGGVEATDSREHLATDQPAGGRRANRIVEERRLENTSRSTGRARLRPSGSTISRPVWQNPARTGARIIAAIWRESFSGCQ